MADDIFRDMSEINSSYLLLPKYLSWAAFEKITMSIKYNMEDHNFDCAQTSLFYNTGVVDFVRVYDQQCTIEKLQHIRNKYLEAIAAL